MRRNMSGDSPRTYSVGAKLAPNKSGDCPRTYYRTYWGIRNERSGVSGQAWGVKNL